MKKNWWIISSYVLAVILFIVISISVILFASGYKIDWQSKTLQKTGFLLVETYPIAAKITVAGRLISKPSPAIIKRLLPGEYLVEINKDTYRSWQANLTIEPGLVTEQRNTLLTFNQLTAKTLLETPLQLIVLSPNSTRIAIATLTNEIILWNIKNKKGVTVSDPSLIIQRLKYKYKQDIANGQITKMDFGPDNKTLLIKINGRYNKYYLSLDVDTGQLNLLTYGNDLDDFLWHAQNEILFTQKNNLYLRPIDAEENNLIAKNIIDYTVYNDIVYIVTKDEFGKHSLVKINKNGLVSPIKELDNLPVAGKYQLIKLRNEWALITQSHNLKSIWSSDHKDNDLLWKKFASNITSDIMQDDKHLIYQSGNKIMTVDLEEKELIPKIILNNQSKLTFIFFGFDTLLYLNNQQLKSVNVTGNNNYELINIGDSNKLAVINPQMHQLIYINPLTKQLESIGLRDKTTGFISLSNLTLRT